MSSDEIYYAVLLSKIPGVDTPSEIVAHHIAFLKDLDNRGKLVLAGPFGDFPGGMLVVRAESVEAATKIAKSDPFVVEGVRAFEVRIWLLANKENGYLG